MVEDHQEDIQKARGGYYLDILYKEIHKEIHAGSHQGRIKEFETKAE